MTKPETDAEFLKRVASSKWKLVDSTVELSTSSFTRLLRLAERGAKIPDAVADIAAERRRQIEVEGWTPAHDDRNVDGSMATAASCYALDHGSRSTPPKLWPWHSSWWKPKDRRRDLVRAAALLVAEIERLDRAMLTTALTKDTDK